jgi:hypothetical protein
MQRISSFIVKQSAFRFTPKTTFKPSVNLFRFYSAGPGPLTLEQIETRVLDLLKDFDKVEAAKVIVAN